MHVKAPENIALMAEAGRRLAAVIEALRGAVRIGVTGKELDRMAEELIRARGDAPAFKGYRPHGAAKAYPATLCFSVNDTVVHGLPSARAVRNGDLVKLDLGLVHEGWYADAAITVPVGNVSAEARRLVEATQLALERAIAAARPGNALGDVGWAVEKTAKDAGFSVAHSLTGHGIGRKLHEDPYVLNTGRPGGGDELVPGMVIAIEPMITGGKGAVKQLPDDSFVTRDGSLAAHFEHTVAITEEGPRILTLI